MKISQFSLSRTPSDDDTFAMLEGGSSHGQITFDKVADWIYGERDFGNSTVVDKVKKPMDQIESVQDEFSDVDRMRAAGKVFVNSISEEMISIDDCGYEEPFDLKLNIEPHQAGSGDPSPDNVRPITGYATVNVYRSGSDTANPVTYPVTLPTDAGTVYGGSLDVQTGVLTVDRGYIASYAGESLPGTWISDRDVYASEATPTTGAQVVYTLATPITYTLIPTEIELLIGSNTLWMDADGTVSMTYGQDRKSYIDKKIAEIQALILENNG